MSQMSREWHRNYLREWRKKHPTYNRDRMRRWRAIPENKISEKIKAWYSK